MQYYLICKFMKKFVKTPLAVLLGLVMIFAIGGCHGGADDGQLSKTPADTKSLGVVTSFYPLYEIIHRLGGTRVYLKNLVPAGSEPHDYEPTPQDVVSLHTADLVIYNGAGLEPWSDKIIPDLQKNGVSVLNISALFKDVVLKDPSSNQENNTEFLPYDPHFWLDPLNYIQEIMAVKTELSKLDPAGNSFYAQNADRFIAQLQDLDQSFAAGLKNCKLHDFVTNHAAFAYLGNRYHLHMIAIAGLSPDAEPSPKTLTELVKLVRSKNIHFILTESLVSPKIAYVVAHETGAKTFVLNPLESLTDEEIAHGKNYLAVMRENLKNLQIALECS